MSSNGQEDCPPSKRFKREDLDSSSQLDEETQVNLEILDSYQNDIDVLTAKASEEILDVERKYNALRKPHLDKRNDYIQKINNFWGTVFSNHSTMAVYIDDEEHDCLRYIDKLEVEEFVDPFISYKIHFQFRSNPYLENSVLTKEIILSEPKLSKSTHIKWKAGQDLVKKIKERDMAIAHKKKSKTHKQSYSFFIWFQSDFNAESDEVAEAIRYEIWTNPLTYYLNADVEVADKLGSSASGDIDDSEGFEGIGDDEESDDGNNASPESTPDDDESEEEVYNPGASEDLVGNESYMKMKIPAEKEESSILIKSEEDSEDLFQEIITKQEIEEENEDFIKMEDIESQEHSSPP